MRVAFLIPSRSRIPSGIVRVMQYAVYLKEKGVDFRVFDYHSPLALEFLRLHERLGGRKGLAGKVVRHALTSCIDLLEAGHWRRESASILKEAAGCDSLFIQWVLPPQEFLRAALERTPIVYDFDDAVFLQEPERAEFMVRNSAAVIAGSRFNHEYASRLNRNTFLIPSPVPVERYPIGNGAAERAAGPVRIGWVGSVSTARYLRRLVEPLELLARDGYDLRLIVAGTWGVPGQLPEIKGVQVEEVPDYDGDSLPRLVSSFHIGVMPVDDTPWERGKCAMKALLYMAAGRPSVSSPVGEINHIVRDGENGLLARDAGEWALRLRGLIDSPAERRRIGINARRTVEEGYSVEVCFRRFYDVLRGIKSVDRET